VISYIYFSYTVMGMVMAYGYWEIMVLYGYMTLVLHI